MELGENSLLITGDFGEEMTKMMMEDLELDYEIICSHYRNIDCNQTYQYVVINQLLDCNLTVLEEVAYLKKIMNLTQDTLIYNGDQNPRIRTNLDLKRNGSVNRLSYGLQSRCDLQAVNIMIANHTMSFDLYLYHDLFGHFVVESIGEQKLYALLAIICILYKEGYDADEISKKLSMIHPQVEYDHHKTSITCKVESEEELAFYIKELYSLNPYDPLMIVKPETMKLNLFNSSLRQAITLVSKIEDYSCDQQDYKLFDDHCSVLFIRV